MQESNILRWDHLIFDRCTRTDTYKDDKSLLLRNRKRRLMLPIGVLLSCPRGLEERWFSYKNYNKKRGNIQ